MDIVLRELSQFYEHIASFKVYVLKFIKHWLTPKRPRQTAQSQIRLLLKKQSDQGLSCLLFMSQGAEKSQLPKVGIEPGP